MVTLQHNAKAVAAFLSILLWSATSFSLNQSPLRQQKSKEGYKSAVQLQHRTRSLPLVLESAAGSQDEQPPFFPPVESSSESPSGTIASDEDSEQQPLSMKSEEISASSDGEVEVDSEELHIEVAAEDASDARAAATLFDYDSSYVVFASALIGVLSGFAVAMFKLSIEAVRETAYGTQFSENFVWWLIPALGGLGVSLLAKTGEFAPGLRGTANEVDELSLNVKEDLRFKNAARFLRKPLAAIITLGSGCSLGPEGPSVEVGMTMSRLCMPPSLQRSDKLAEVDAAARIRRNRLLLSAGAAAGVAAGFNAPLAGVFFALEILQQNLPPLTIKGGNRGPLSNRKETTWQQQVQQDYLSSGSGSITAILLASVLSALVSQVYLGEELALSVPSYHLNTPLVELPLVSVGKMQQRKNGFHALPCTHLLSLFLLY